MVQFYNISSYSDQSGYIGFIQNTSSLTNFYFGIMILLVFFILIVYRMLKNDNSAIDSFNIGGLYSVILAIVFFATGIIVNAIFIWVFALIFCAERR